MKLEWKEGKQPVTRLQVRMKSLSWRAVRRMQCSYLSQCQVPGSQVESVSRCWGLHEGMGMGEGMLRDFPKDGLLQGLAESSVSGGRMGRLAPAQRILQDWG